MKPITKIPKYKIYLHCSYGLYDQKDWLPEEFEDLESAAKYLAENVERIREEYPVYKIEIV